MLAQEPDRPLEAFTGPFTHLVYGAETQEMDTIGTIELDQAGLGEDYRSQQSDVEVDNSGRRVRRNLKPQWQRVRMEGAYSYSLRAARVSGLVLRDIVLLAQNYSH